MAKKLVAETRVTAAAVVKAERQGDGVAEHMTERVQKATE